jgi:MoaA/NifB/PqqE/SkfB family radical SAM enzyme
VGNPLEIDAMIDDRSRREAPAYYTYYTTLRCNLNCDMCYQRDQRKKATQELSFAEAVAMFERVENLERVNLIGGEVFVRRDALDLMEYLDAREVMTYVTTNGTLLDPGQVERLLALRHLLGVTVSLDALGNSQPSLRGHKSDPDAIMDVICRLARGTQVRINSVLLTENTQTIETFETLIPTIARAGVALLKVQLQIAHSPWVIEQTEEYVRAWMGGPVSCLYPRETHIWDAARLQSTIRHIRQVAAKYNLPVLIFPPELMHHLEAYAAETLWSHYHLQCEGAQRIPRMKLLPNGDAIFCEGLDIRLGNLREQTPNAIWTSHLLRAFYENFERVGGLPICGRCCRVVVGSRRTVPMR